jgi:hypothetical protein
LNRRLIGLLATVCLASACREEPVGKMEPIPRPPGMGSAPEKAEAPAAKPAPAPAPSADPSKVVMRWKLDAPIAFRLTTSSSASAPPPAPKGKKGKQPEPASSARESETSSIFVLRKTDSGEYAVTITPQEPGGTADQGTMSERGFVVDGLSGPLHTKAALVLELPMDAVGKGTTWALGVDLVDLSSVPNFVERKAERHNQVKLLELTPAENGEQVATLEYDVSESVSGNLRAFKSAPEPKPEKKDAGGKKDARAAAEDKDEDPKAAPLLTASAEVRVKGRGEFLVKAGRWRSWEGTLSTSTEGALPGLSGGERKLRLTPLESVPPELLPQQAKK